MATWPASLPIPTDQGVTFAPLVENVITTGMETGAPKRRRRFTNVPKTVTFQLVLEPDEIATLDTFVQDTLGDVLPFDWRDFVHGGSATYVFQKRPVYSLISAPVRLWRATIELVKQ